jgi:hypothetical protein
MLEPGWAIERMSGQRFCLSSARRHFQVRPLSVHQMVLTLERRVDPATVGLVRTINVLVSPERVPVLSPANRSNPLCRGNRVERQVGNSRSRSVGVLRTLIIRLCRELQCVIVCGEGPRFLSL